MLWCDDVHVSLSVCNAGSCSRGCLSEINSDSACSQMSVSVSACTPQIKAEEHNPDYIGRSLATTTTTTTNRTSADIVKAVVPVDVIIDSSRPLRAGAQPRIRADACRGKVAQRVATNTPPLSSWMQNKIVTEGGRFKKTHPLKN